MKSNRIADLLLIFSAFVSVQAAALRVNAQVLQPNDTVSFERFAVPVYAGKIAPIDWKSNSSARHHRKLIQSKVKKGANFAGHYRVVEWRCTGGTRWRIDSDSNYCGVIVDLKTGKIFGEETSGYGMDFRPDSRMILPKDLYPYPHAGGPPPVFEWQDNQFRLVRFGGR